MMRSLHGTVVRLPGRLGRLRPLSRDPTLVVLAFAAWSLLFGLSLLGPGDTLPNWPSARALIRLGVSEDAWGWAMLLDGVALASTAFCSRPVICAGVAALSGAFRLYFGAYVVAGAMEIRIFSAVGCWEIAAGLALLAATVQWAAQEDGRHDG